MCNCQQEQQYQCWVSTFLHQCIGPHNIPATWQKSINDLPFSARELGLGMLFHCLSPRPLPPYWVRSHCLLPVLSLWSAPLWGENPTFCILGSPQRHSRGLRWRAPGLWSFLHASRTVTCLVLLQRDASKLHVSHGLSCLPSLPTHHIHRQTVHCKYIYKSRDNVCMCNLSF